MSFEMVKVLAILDQALLLTEPSMERAYTTEEYVSDSIHNDPCAQYTYIRTLVGSGVNVSSLQI